MGKMISDNALSTAKYSAEFIVQGASSLKALTRPFLIPIYQRLYTWEAQHVECLLRDLWEAYKQSTDSEYFIGAVVISPSKSANESQTLELIDGQQRMTTLWLIASVLVTKTDALKDESLKLWKEFMALDKGGALVARLDFSGRENDKAALKNFIQNWQCSCGGNACGTGCNGWLKNEAMAIARSTIIKFFNRGAHAEKGLTEQHTVSTEIQSFSDYIWSKATFVITQLHAETDKNRFFDTMNSRGIQLEKHEILKAKLLNGMDEQSRLIYAKAWDLCADIHGYMPKEIQSALNYGRTLLTKEFIEKKLASESKKNVSEPVVTSIFTLENILKLDVASLQPEAVKGRQVKEYRSLVSFPVFLLHVLRLFTLNAGGINVLDTISVDDKKLISQFESHLRFSDKDQSKSFITFLLECRLLLDNFVIKGHVDEGNEFARWEIWSHLAGKDDSKREKRTGKDWDSITFLQTMMYFSQDNTRVPWLTNVLKNLRDSDQNKDRVAINTDGPQFLKQLTQQDKKYAEDRFSGTPLEQLVGAGNFSGLGTRVPHYWFYKLEYCLWEMWFNQNPLEKKVKCSKPNILIKANNRSSAASFRIRHVTSIEHVSPQSKNNGVITHLDRFGNLALISVGANSSYSDKDPSVKASEFKLKLGKGMIESLKLAHIFNDYGNTPNDWNNDAMIKHENAMVSVLKAFHPELGCDNNKEAGSGI
jgi:uncharacterized protein with ParB-like and HNH nuclease domain